MLVYFARDRTSNFLCIQRTHKYSWFSWLILVSLYSVMQCCWTPNEWRPQRPLVFLRPLSFMFPFQWTFVQEPSSESTSVWLLWWAWKKGSIVKMTWIPVNTSLPDQLPIWTYSDIICLGRPPYFSNNNSYIAWTRNKFYELAALYIIYIDINMTNKKSTSILNAYIFINMTINIAQILFFPLSKVSSGFASWNFVELIWWLN